MLNGILDPAFLQAAGRAGKSSVGTIILHTLVDNPGIDTISGNVTVTSIKNGTKITETYALDAETLSIEADAQTVIRITGEITGELNFGSSKDFDKISVKNTALTSLNCYDCYALQALDLRTNTALTSLDCSSCYALQALDLRTNTALTSLDCYDCYALQALDLRTNTALTSLSCDSCTKIKAVYYPATDSGVATKVASLITGAEADDGTVYTDSAAAYYSTIATAATTKGWTIAAIPA